MKVRSSSGKAGALPEEPSVADQTWSQSLATVQEKADQLIAMLMIPQYLALATIATRVVPDGLGALKEIDSPAWTMLIYGLMTVLCAGILAIGWPAKRWSRLLMAILQTGMAVLMVTAMNGMVNVLYPMFGTLGLLCLYRDWRTVLVSSIAFLGFRVSQTDLIRAIATQSLQEQHWQVVEMAIWLVFISVILGAVCVASARDLRLTSARQAELEVAHKRLREAVMARYRDKEKNAQRQTAVVNHALDGILSLDSEGHILDMNPAAEHIFRRPREEMIGRAIIKLLPQDRWGIITDSLNALKKNAEENVLNKRVMMMALDPEGEEFPIELSLTADRLNEFSFVTAFVRDISEQKKLETKLAHAQKMESIGQLSTGIAHEINTPNQYIGDNVRFLMEGTTSLFTALDSYDNLVRSVKGAPKPLIDRMDQIQDQHDISFLKEEMPRAIEQALEGVDRVGHIVRAMKDFAHPGSRRHTSVDINQVIDNTITICKHEWKYAAQMDLHLGEDVPIIQGDPGELGQVLLNMIVNSAHAIQARHGTSGAGVISIATRKNEDAVEIMVRDNGIGIPKRVQERIFDPFFTTKGVGIGTGQGLAIAHSVIAERHDGEIKLYSVEGQGTEFRIRLPITGAERLAKGDAA